MIQTIIHIEGMACGMCEAHINDAIRNHFQVKKVSSSYRKKQSEVLSEASLDADQVRAVIDATGYTFLSLEEKPYEKKGLFGRK